MRYQAILWDLDDTLLDFKKGELQALKETFKQIPITILDEEKIQTYLQYNARYWQLFEQNQISKEDLLVARYRDFLRHYQLDETYAEKLNERYLNLLGEFVYVEDGAIKTLQALRPHYAFYLCTNGVSHTQHQKLLKSGLGVYFDDLFISDEIGVGKPNVAFFEYVEKKIQCPKQAMLMIGDSLSSDMLGAYQYGIDKVWYNPKHKENQKHLPIEYEVDALEKIVSLLGGF